MTSIKQNLNHQPKARVTYQPTVNNLVPFQGHATVCSLIFSEIIAKLFHCPNEKKKRNAPHLYNGNFFPGNSYSVTREIGHFRVPWYSLISS